MTASTKFRHPWTARKNRRRTASWRSWKPRLSGIFGEDARTIVSRLVKSDGRKHAPQYAVAFVMMFLVAGTTGLTAYLMRDVINHIFVERNHMAVSILGGTLIALFLW